MELARYARCLAGKAVPHAGLTPASCAAYKHHTIKPTQFLIIALHNPDAAAP